MILGIFIGIAIVIYAMAFTKSAEDEYKGDNNNFKL